MADEKFIEWLWKIKELCKNTKCKNCPFSIEYGCCQIDDLVDVLQADSPRDWNMEEIERIIRL